MYILKTASVLSFSAFWLIMVVCPAASLVHSDISGALSRIDYVMSARSPASNHYDPSLRTSSVPSGSIDKRGKAWDLTLVSFEPGEVLMPVQAAAGLLEDFYTNIAAGSLGIWAKNTPRIWIRMSFGAIRLVMTATEGTTVPWDFVTWFSLEMLKLTERGYTGTYTANFVSPTMGNAVWVSLYHCAIGPFTDPAAVSAPAKVASCLNAQAQAWFPSKGTPMR